jgi:signal transduction histidine kinase/ActR/RegA family two-component response regulator
MAQQSSSVEGSESFLSVDRSRMANLLEVLESMAAGEIDKRLPTSNHHDELDAIAHGINILVGELGWSAARALEAKEATAAELRAAVVQAERANASKNIFLRNVSHEIRTPIAAMLGFAELLASSQIVGEERADLTRRLQSNGKAVLSVLGDLLDISRLDADKVVLAPEDVSLLELVHEILASFEVKAGAKDLDISVQVTADAVGTLRTDRQRVRQILVNLIANAIKFTEAGSIVIALRASGRGDPVEWLIEVSDTGIGIAGDRHAYLFEPFEQGDASIQRAYGGTGLGLALSRRLAEQLGGSLTLVRSAPGEGSTFRLTLRPLSSRADAVAAAPAGQSPPLKTSIRGVRILVVDDHPDVLIAVRRFLEQAGAVVATAGDGHEALQTFKSGAFDILLMDLRMPRMDGIQVTRLLRSEGYSLPIVALSADPAASQRAEAMEAGCDLCLSKPFSMEELIGAVSLMLHRETAPATDGRWAERPV